MLRDLLLAFPWLKDIFYAGCLYAAWRVWTFTVKPWLRPDEPVDLPYWIPFLGHTVNFFKDYVQLLEDGLNYTGRQRSAFAIQLLGKKLYVCTDPKDVSTIFDDTVAFGFDDHLTNLLTSFGISKPALERAWHVPKPGDWCYVPNNPVNPKQKSLIHAVEDLCTQQLLPGEKMDVWAEAFLGSIKKNLRGTDDLLFCAAGESCVWCGSRSCGQDGATGCKGARERQVALYKLVSFFSVQATCRAMFGSHFFDIDDKVVEHMLEFNEHVWMVVFRRPKVWAKLPVEYPQEKLMAIARRFVDLPEEKRSGASWAITNILRGMDIVGMDVESRAAMVLMIFWAAVSNEHNSCFWLIARLVHDESLLGLVKKETEAAWRPGPDGEPELDIKYLCANCPNLDAIFNEVLRLNNTAAAVRVATHGATLSGGKVIPRDGMLVLPFRQLHTNESVWGHNVGQFDATRFLHGANAPEGEKKKDMSRNASFRPFGGGATYCPGRTLAKHEVFGTVAILLRRFDIRLAKRIVHGGGPDGEDVVVEEKPPLPQLNSSTPSFGLNGPVPGQDVIVNISERVWR